MVKRGDQQRIALWGTVVLVSLYLVLTWALLLTSIDAVEFRGTRTLRRALSRCCRSRNVHLHAERRPHRQPAAFGRCLRPSALGLMFAPDAFGGDSATMVSTHSWPYRVDVITDVSAGRRRLDGRSTVKPWRTRKGR